MKRPNDIEDLQREIQRLQEAKRRALAIADERSKEAVELRLENERLRARLAECDHRRWSHRMCNRQRLATHARRLRR